MKKKKTEIVAPVVRQILKLPLENSFGEVLQLIQSAKQRAYRAVDAELVQLYWQVGEYISRKIESAEWGDKVVAELARFLGQTQPGLRGFTRPNLFRMRQFFEAYTGNEIVAPLVRQLPWTHNMIILSQSRREEEREFYVRLAIREKWTKRELERQIRIALFERAVMNPPKVAAVLRQLHPEVSSIFKDVYTLEALDRDYRKPHENPAVGLLLCATKDSEVVEYCLSRSLSPAMIAEYETMLPDKELLKAKLHEFYQLCAPPEDEDDADEAPSAPAKPKRKKKGATA